MPSRKSLSEFITGQRWLSETENQLGLGTVTETDHRTITITFESNGESRIYAKETAPLLRISFSENDEVSLNTGETVTLQQVEELNGLFLYQGITSAGEIITFDESRLASNLQLSKPSERLLSGQVDKSKWFELRYLTRQYQNSLSHSSLYGLIGVRTDLIPHQLYISHEVAKRYAPRVLLADEVGLGKTIEAGLILHQQLISGRAQRVLIVVPESLVHQWMIEMLRRFNLHFSLFDENRCQAIEEDGTENCFHSEQLVLCSQGFFSANLHRVEQALEGDWDMLIVDEAHHLEWSEEHASLEYQIIEQLAQQTRGVLLLTATPEQLGKQGHFARLRLLDPERFASYDEFAKEQQSYEPVARLITEILEHNKPITELLPDILAIIDRSEDDDAFHHMVARLKLNSNDEEASQYIIDQLLDRHGTGRILFRNTRDAVKGFPERQLHSYELPCPQIYQQQADQFELNSGNEQYLLSPDLLFSGEAANTEWLEFDPRVEWLKQKVIDLAPQKVLVIASSAETVVSLNQMFKFKTSLQTAVFHEAMTLLERDRAAAWFADHEDGAQVLLCSEIGSEGRNFQFAHHLIFFDLPYNPDLLEQRIGRLDRIGQTETIQIHVPYLQNHAQAIMFNWYHEALNAFEHAGTSGLFVQKQFADELHAALQNPDDQNQSLIKSASEAYQTLLQELHNGRDRLLEYNSCRQATAEQLIEQALENQHVKQLSAYMDKVFDCFGLDNEWQSDDTYIVKPGEQMQHSYFPGITEEGITITYNRDRALSQDNLQFLSWEHPMVLGAMDLTIDHVQGNTALVALPYKQTRPGTMMIEALYILETADSGQYHSSRYLPVTTMRLVLDEQLREHTDNISHVEINLEMQGVNRNTARQVIEAKSAELKSIIKHCHTQIDTQAQQVIADARLNAENLIQAELHRLESLQQHNAHVRLDEINYLKNQLAHIENLLASAKPRLDSVRAIITV